MKKGWDKGKVTLGDFADDLYLVRVAIKSVEVILLLLFGTTFFLVGCYLSPETRNKEFLFLFFGGLFIVLSAYNMIMEVLKRWKLKKK